jgi:hypothetical protein
LRLVGEKEREILPQLEKEGHQEHSIPFDGEFYIWSLQIRHICASVY